MRVVPMSGRKAMKVLEHLGWFINNSDGRHRIYAKHGVQNQVTVPDHKELQTGTLRNIIKQAGLTVDQFYETAARL